MIFRIINVIISAVVSYSTFTIVYAEFYSYLPTYKKLIELNTAATIPLVLRDNSIGLRELYNHAFEKSMLFCLIAFVVSLIVLEYVRFGPFMQGLFRRKPLGKEVNT